MPGALGRYLAAKAPEDAYGSLGRGEGVTPSLQPIYIVNLQTTKSECYSVYVGTVSTHKTRSFIISCPQPLAWAAPAAMPRSSPPSRGDVPRRLSQREASCQQGRPSHSLRQ